MNPLDHLSSVCVTLPSCLLLSQSDTGSEKENPLSRRPSSCQPPARFTCRDSNYERTTSTAAAAADSHWADHQHQAVAGDPDADADLSPASQREEGEGWDREQAKRLEERNKWFEEGLPLSEMGSRWESMELKRGSVPVPVIEAMDFEVNRKWAEFEKLSFSDMSAQSLIGAQACQPSIPQALQSLNSSQTFQASPEETTQSVTVSETDILSSKGPLSSINGAQTTQTNTAEALQKEVRKSLQGCFNERKQC